MPLTGAHPAETSAAALRLLSETDLFIAAIAARVGASARTVWHWNVRAGWPRPPRRRWMLTARWPAARRAALLRLLGASGADPADIAEVLGLRIGAGTGRPRAWTSRRPIRRSCGRSCAATSPGRSPRSMRR